MGLETGTYPSDFVLTNPTAGDPVAQADDHMRLIKTCVQNALPIGAANYPLTSGTVQATTSGTSFDFTIPSWAKRITVTIASVSIGSSDTLAIRLGDSGGIEATGYNASVTNINASSTPSSNLTTGFPIALNIAAVDSYHGSVVIELHNSTNNSWTYRSITGASNAPGTHHGAGSKSLSGALTTVRLTTHGGASFDAGSVNVLYE